MGNQYRPVNPNHHPGAHFHAVNDGVLCTHPSQGNPSGRIHCQSALDLDIPRLIATIA
ncbi:hypothetical protein C1H46_033137 [Malus baccata]|uniref:Uncharacterized protein n=1 Tax=Malus baccata TaxID=106549 RepID=A0A540L4B6_MALBA|nr:hypothetical protein C1H46_033137 [Malus baccata]